MVTDEMMDAMDMLIEICSDEKQKKGMETIRGMLADFDEGVWLCTERPSDCYDWLEQYLSCRRNTEEEIKKNRVAQAKKLWKEFGDIPMNPETECIEETWCCFPTGTYREEIWHWFEEAFKLSVAEDLMKL